MTCNQWFWAEDEDGNYPPVGPEFVLQKWDGSDYATIGYYSVPATGVRLDLVDGGIYKAIPILDTSYEDDWTRPRDVQFTSCKSDVTFVYTRKVSASLELDGVGIDYWVGNKAYLKGHIRNIVTSDEICVVFMYPGLSTHQAILSTKSSTQYIYLKDTSGDYDLAANERYIPFDNDGTYAVRIIDVSGNCEDWSGERDITGFTLTGDMMRVPVISSNIKSIGWIDPSTLEVEFLSGTIYRYYYVPLDIYMGMLEATSKGKYFWQHIRCKTQSCTGGNIPYPYLKIK